MSRFFVALGRFDVRYRWFILASWILLTIVVSHTLPTLASVSKDTQSGFLPSSAPSVQAQALAGPFQNTAFAGMTLVASRDGGPLTAADVAAITSLESSISRMNHVKVVRDLGTSADGHAQQAQIQADVPQFGTGDGPALVDAIRDDFTRVAAPAGLSFHLTGQLATIVDEQSANKSSQNAIQAFSLLFIIVLLFVGFRALLAPIVTLMVPALVLSLAGYAIAAATHIGVQASSITQFMLVVLVLGAGTDYGLFLVFRTREEMRRGLTPKEAVARSVATVGESITFSALIVIVALLSLLIAQFGFYQSLGPGLAIGIAIMLLAGLTLLPALLAIFGRALFWPTSTKHNPDAKAGIWGRAAGLLIQKPLLTAAVGLVAFVALALGQLGTTTAGFADQSSGPAGADSTQGTAVVAAHYATSSVFPNEILFHFATPVWSSPKPVQVLTDRLRSSSTFTAVFGPLNPNNIPVSTAQITAAYTSLGPPQNLPPQQASAPPAARTLPPAAYNAYRSLAQYVSSDGHTVQFVATLRNGSSSDPAAIAAMPQLRDEVSADARAAGADDSGVFGLLPFAYDVSHISQSDLGRIIPTVAVLIALLLGIVLRSAVGPLYLVPSVLLSYLASLGLVALVFVHLGGQSGTNFVLPFLMYVFLMALGSDYNVLVMTRIREEAQHRPLRAAVRHAIGATGTTVTTAGVILGGTFAVLAVAGGASGGSGAAQIQQIGYGVAAGVILDTFVVRTVVVPSIVVLLGRWNWWPSRLSRPSPVEEEAAA